MKKSFILCLFLAVFSVSLTAQTKKEMREKERQQNFAKAKQLFDAQSFIIPADVLIVNGGQTIFADGSVTFLKMNEGNAVLQISPDVASSPGANGLGGITAQGNVINLTENNTDKQLNMNFTIEGSFGAADIRISVLRGNRADVNIRGVFNDVLINMDGNVMPIDSTNYFEGTP